MKNALTHVVAAVKLLAKDLSVLRTPFLASAVAGTIAAVLGAAGVNVNTLALVPVITAVGTGAGVLEKILSGATSAPFSTPAK